MTSGLKKEETIMKKISTLFGLFAIAAFVFSCSKEDAQINPSENISGEVSPAVEVPATDGNLLTSFGVTFESDAEDSGLKVSVNVDSGEADIENGDEVLVFVSGSNHAVYTYDGESSKFILKDGETAVTLDGPAGVFYPADEHEIAGSGVKLIMPSSIEASGDFGAINPMAGRISGSEGAYTVELRNVISVLRVRVFTDSDINSVTLDYGTGYAGGSKYYINPSSLEMDYSDASGNNFETFTLDTPANHADVLFMLPTLELSNGLTVTANLAGGSTRSISRAAYTPEKNKISSMSFYSLFSGGKGTSDKPYLIANAEDFKNLQKYTSEGYCSVNGFTAEYFRNASYKQTADIDFNNAVLSPIGEYNATAADAKPFKGVYDGDGKTLSKFKVNGTQAASTGLFEYIDGATLKNIKIGPCQVTGENVAGILTGRCIGNTTIEGCSFTGPGNVIGRNSVGFIAHIYGDSKVKNCSVTNLTVVTADDGPNANNQGGVVGFAGGNSSIVLCTPSGNIQFTGTASGIARGGIVGKFDSTGEVKSCTNGAIISNGLVGQTGGIAGALSNGSIVSCANTAAVSGTTMVGGIAGTLSNGTIVSCANTAAVSGTTMVGGIVGFAGNTTTDGSATNITFITSCRNAANVTGTANCVGGIAGKLQNGAVMSACYAQGDVKTSTYDVGGLTGLIQINNNNATSRIYVYDCIANMNVSTSRTSGACRTGGAVGNITIGETGQYVAIDNCGVLDVTISAGGEYVGGFAGWMTGDGTNTNRARIRNCYTLVSSVPGSAKKGGFIGAVTNKAELRYDYFVADDSSDISTATTVNYSKKTAAEIQSEATCTTFNGNNFSLNVGSTGYSSAKGWALKNGYPVPGALIALGSDYYK